MLASERYHCANSLSYCSQKRCFSVCLCRGACASRQVLCGPALAKNSPLVHISGKTSVQPVRMHAKQATCARLVHLRCKSQQKGLEVATTPSVSRQHNGRNGTWGRLARLGIPERVLQGCNSIGCHPMGCRSYHKALLCTFESILYKNQVKIIYT